MSTRVEISHSSRRASITTYLAIQHYQETSAGKSERSQVSSKPREKAPKMSGAHASSLRNYKLRQPCQARRLLLGFGLLLLNQLLLSSIQAMHIQRPYHGNADLIERRQDSDDEEMDSNASAPYQNQDDSSRPADSYEDAEADGPYGETPREEEGQADLERFFDDHLGASERDGMDKENLPTNLVPVVLLQANQQAAQSSADGERSGRAPVMVPYKRVDPPLSYLDKPEPKVQEKHRAGVGDKSVLVYKPNQSRNGNANILSASLADLSSPEPTSSYPRIETSYVHLPDNKLIITRHITRDLLKKPDFVPAQEREPERDQLSVSNRLTDNGDIDSTNDLSPSQSLRALRHRDTRRTQAPVVRLEDDDMDTVYVTNVTNKPFRIESLGGFDPEEDFRDASLDIADSESDGKAGSRSASSRRRVRMQPSNPRQERGSQSIRDINFGDPEADSMFYDASETDEVTFDADDDPYQTDLEAELHAQAYDKPGQVSQSERKGVDHHPSEDVGSDVEVEFDPGHVEKNGRAGRQHKRKEVQEQTVPRRDVNRRQDEPDDDESEGRWLNDGVDEMEIPSKGHQESVLKKAALAAEARHDDDETGPDGRIDPVEEQPVQEETTKSKPIDQPTLPAGNEGDQRMPNADYLKDDMKTDDLDYKA